jgi:O-antigen ligase
MRMQASITERLPDVSAVSSRGLASALDRVAYAALCAFIFVIPWDESVPLLGGFLIGRWLGLLAFSVAVLSIGASGRVRRISAVHYALAGLAGWSALSILWTADWDSTVTRAGTYLQLLTAVWLIWELTATESRVLGLLQCYVLGTYVSSISTIVNFIQDRTAAQLVNAKGGAVWDVPRYTISGVNENDLGVMLALSIPMAFYLLARRKHVLVRSVCWLQLVAAVTAILLTGSRGALFAASIAILLAMAFRLPPAQRLALTFAGLGIVASGTLFIPQAIWDRLSSVGTEMSEGTMTHRTVIWAAGMEAVRDHAFLGVGAGAYGLTVLKAVDIPYVAHNTFISVFVELGIVGALLLGVLLATAFLCAIQMPSLERCLWITLLLTWSVGVSSLTWEYRKPTWFLFGMLAAHVYARRSEPSYAEPGWGPTPSAPSLTWAPPPQRKNHGARLWGSV